MSLIALCIEISVTKLLAQQEHASHMQSEMVKTLHKLNHTFQFLLKVSDISRDQLNWIQSLVANTGMFYILIDSLVPVNKISFFDQQKNK